MPPSNDTKDVLATAIEQEQNCREICYYAPGDSPSLIFNSKENVHIVFRNAETANNYVTILRELPKILADHSQLTDVVTELVGLVALQQAQLRELQHQLDHALHARVAVQAQKDAYENVQATIARGSNIGKQEITVQVRAVAESRRMQESEKKSSADTTSLHSSARSESARTISERAGEIAADVKGLVRAVAGLKVSGKLRTKAEKANDVDTSSSNKVVARVRALEKIEAQEDYRSDFAGTMTLKVENITGDPIVQAQADAIRRGFGQSVETNRVLAATYASNAQSVSAGADHEGT